MYFLDCLRACANNMEFVAQFDRLYGTHLAVDRRTLLESMIDKATGYDDVEERYALREFVEFVHTYIWTPITVQEGEDAAVDN